MSAHLPLLGPGTTENQDIEMEMATLNRSTSDVASGPEDAESVVSMTTDEAQRRKGSKEWKEKAEEENGEPEEEEKESPSARECAKAKCSHARERAHEVALPNSSLKAILSQEQAWAQAQAEGEARGDETSSMEASCKRALAARTAHERGMEPPSMFDELYPDSSHPTDHSIPPLRAHPNERGAQAAHLGHVLTTDQHEPVGSNATRWK